MKPQIHLYQHGGIGDQIVAFSLIQQFEHPDYEVVLYTKFPEVAKLYMPQLTIKLRQDLDKDAVAYWVELIDVVTFNFRGPKPPFAPHVEKMYETYLKNIAAWGPIITRHPGTCNEMGVKAVRQRLHRWDLPFYLIGLKYKRFTPPHFPAAASTKKYITVHDGFDDSHTFELSMKSWGLDSWAEFVKKFKARYSHIDVYQLGGKKHRPIEGVDFNYAGKLSFENSMLLLSGADLHIDGDSGLVHARHLYGGKSIVIFGPTNIDYFAYPENINIRPSFCGACWWLKRDWMRNCVKGFEVKTASQCMASTTADMVLQKCEGIFNV